MSVEIEAAKLILACFLDEPENEVQRNNLIRGKVAENEKVKKMCQIFYSFLFCRLKSVVSGDCCW
jgi:hypothetical protein